MTCTLRTRIKETEDDTKKCNNTVCYRSGKIKIDKMTILPKSIYRFNAILIEILLHFHRTVKNNLNIHMEPQKTPHCQSNLEREKIKNRAGGVTLSDFRLNYKATVNKTVKYWHKKKHINGTE